MPIHRLKTYVAERPAFRMPAALESPSGTLDKKIAITATKLTTGPPIMLTPITIDSGIPSSRAPTAIAIPLSSSEGC